MTMQSTWRRSLMGVVLMAALAPGDDGPRAGGSPAGPAGPGEIGPKAAGKKPRDAAELEKLRKQQREVVEELNRLLREAAKRFSPGLEDDPLQARIKELEAKKAKLEGELKDLLSRRYIKVFRLKHASPEQLKEALDNLLNEDSSGAQGGGPLPGGPGTGGPPGMTPPAVGRPGMGAGMRPPGGGFNFGPGGAPAWRVTVDDRTRSLIVRGNRDVLQTAADLVAVLDAPADKPLPRVQKVRAFRLRFARAEGLAEIIGDLGLRARLYPLPKSNMLLVSGSDAVLKEIGELIQELDVEGKGQPGKNKE